MSAGQAATLQVFGRVGRIIAPSPSFHAPENTMGNPQSAPIASDHDAGSVPAESSFELLVRAKDGDLLARERLFTRFLPRVRRWAHGRLPANSRSLLNTDDLAQEVLCRAFVSLETFDPRHDGAFPAFLRRILVNRVRDEIRSATRRPAGEPLDNEPYAEDPSPVELAIGTEALERYERALLRLKPHERELVVARFELDFTNEEIATLFEKPSIAAARVAVGRALAKLAEEMSRD